MRRGAAARGRPRPQHLAIATVMNYLLTVLFLALAVKSSHGAIRSDEHIIFFPSFASQTVEGWRLSIHGWVHEPETRPVLGAFLRRAIPIDRDKLTDAEREIYRE